MSKYFVACDLDDTLLTKNKKISFKSRMFIKKFVKKGNYFVICTGRPFSSANNFAKMLNVKMPIISDNGASIYLPMEDRFIYFSINLDIFKELLEQTNDYINCAIANSNEKVVFQNRKEIPEWLVHYLPDAILIDDTLLNSLDYNPILPTIWVKKDKKDEFEKILKTYYNEISYRYWGLFDNGHSFELFSPNASKGLAMKYLAEYYDCDKTIAFGDQLNDLSMILMADYGVAMINGKKEALEVAKYHTRKDNKHNGVIDFLKKNKLY